MESIVSEKKFKYTKVSRHENNSNGSVIILKLIKMRFSFEYHSKNWLTAESIAEQKIRQRQSDFLHNSNTI